MKKTLLTYISTLCLILSVNAQTFTKTIIDGITGNNPYVLDSGQLDDDSGAYPDIVIGTDGGNTVEIYLNNGDGTFPNSGTVLTATAPNHNLLYVEGVHIADINEDGDNDILATGYGNDRVVWFEGNGDGTYQDAVALLDNIDGAGTVITGNLHEDLAAPVDNNLDLVVVANGPDGDTDSVIFLLGNGDGTFGSIQYIAPQTVDSGPGDVDLADFDGDGDLDAVVAFTENGDVYLYDNNFIPSGTVSFTRYTNPVSTGNGWLFDVSFADLNDDGNLDIIKSDNIPGANPGVVWYTNDSSGLGTTYSANPVTTTISRPGRAAVANLNDDLYNDLIVTNGVISDDDVIWFTSDSMGGLGSENSIDNTQQAVYDITINDFDKDGDLDLVTVSYFQNDLNIFENDLYTLSTDDVDIAINNISIYPNPTKGTLRFKTNINEDFNVEIYDILGKQIMPSTTLNSDSSLDVSTLHNGIYIVKFPNYNLNYKIVKE